MKEIANILNNFAEQVSNEAEVYKNAFSLQPNSPTEKAAIGLSLLNNENKKFVILTFFPLLDASLLTDKCKELYKELIQQKQEIDNLLKNYGTKEK